jgi:hypothetical protein
MGEITVLLDSARSGDAVARDALFSTIYAELQKPTPSPKGGGGALGFGWSAFLGLIWLRRRVISARQTRGVSRCIAMDLRRSRSCVSRPAAAPISSTELAG